MRERGVFPQGIASLSLLSSWSSILYRVKDWKAEKAKLTAEKAARNDGYKKLKEETREVEIIRREVEQMIKSRIARAKKHGNSVWNYSFIPQCVVIILSK
jgi:Cys-tRNA synthase (O-phospho-L-seryl-tRNA:Cys-tRNA synthase)